MSLTWIISQYLWQNPIGRLFCFHPAIFKTCGVGVCVKCHKTKRLEWWEGESE